MKSTITKAIKIYGKSNVVIKAMSELATLVSCLSKSIRCGDIAEDLAEQIAKVEIMLDEVKELYYIDNETKHNKDILMSRLSISLNDKVADVIAERTKANIEEFRELLKERENLG